MAFSFTFPYHFCFISAPQNDDVWFLCEEIAHTVSSTEIEEFSFNCEKLIFSFGSLKPRFFTSLFLKSYCIQICLQYIVESKICFVKDL